MALAVNIPLITYRGDSPTFTFVLKDSAGVVVDITGYVFTMTVDTLEEPLDVTDPSATEVFTNTGTSATPASGEWTHQPTALNTALTPGEYFYDVSVAVGTQKITLVKSVLEVLQDIGKA